MSRANTSPVRVVEHPAKIGAYAGAERYLQREASVDHGDASNHVRIYAQDAGQGQYVTLLPSLGRGVEDYTEQYHSTLTTRLVEAGYRVVLIQPRGITKGYGDLSPESSLTLDMLVEDLKDTLDGLGIGRLHVVGHGFGGRVAQLFALRHGSYVDALALLTPRENAEPGQEVERCLLGSFDMTLTEGERLQNVDCAFFAEGNDPTVWLWGWYPDLAQRQLVAAESVEPALYASAGGKRFLVVQASEDAIAPPGAAGKALKQKLGEQVSYVEIAHAGHALSPEQPEELANQLIAYLRKERP